MRKLVLKMDMSLDGFVAPIGEDAGWIMRDLDDELSRWLVDDVLWQAGTHIMGRVTYEDMAAHWPSATSVFAAPMNEIPKVVFSRTLTKAEWPDSRIADGDLAEEILRLKEETGKNILVHGGAGFVQALSKLDLIDVYRVIVHPVALGSGSALFGAALDLTLVDSTTFATGAVALTYETGRA